MKHIHKGTSLTTCASIDIGLVNKYYDLPKSGDTLAAGYYRTLEVNAGSCIGCRHCMAVRLGGSPKQISVVLLYFDTGFIRFNYFSLYLLLYNENIVCRVKGQSNKNDFSQ